MCRDNTWCGFGMGWQGLALPFYSFFIRFWCLLTGFDVFLPGSAYVYRSVLPQGLSQGCPQASLRGGAWQGCHGRAWMVRVDSTLSFCIRVFDQETMQKNKNEVSDLKLGIFLYIKILCPNALFFAEVQKTNITKFP